LVASLVGSPIRFFSLALAGGWRFLRLVIGVGIVVFAHCPATMTANSATQQFSITPQPITNHFATLPRSGLVQQDIAPNR
jgi:hypothetical protein